MTSIRCSAVANIRQVRNLLEPQPRRPAKVSDYAATKLQIGPKWPEHIRNCVDYQCAEITL